MRVHSQTFTMTLDSHLWPDVYIIVWYVYRVNSRVRFLMVKSFGCNECHISTYWRLNSIENHQLMRQAMLVQLVSWAWFFTKALIKPLATTWLQYWSQEPIATATQIETAWCKSRYPMTREQRCVYQIPRSLVIYTITISFRLCIQHWLFGDI